MLALTNSLMAATPGGVEVIVVPEAQSPTTTGPLPPAEAKERDLKYLSDLGPKVAALSEQAKKAFQAERADAMMQAYKIAVEECPKKTTTTAACEGFIKEVEQAIEGYNVSVE